MPCELVLVKKNAVVLLFLTVVVEVGGEEPPDFGSYS